MTSSHWEAGITIHQTEIQQLNCTDTLKSGISTYAMNLSEILGDSLIGIYIYGSLARGCYHPATSDVDIIVVVKNSYLRQNDMAIINIHYTVGAPVDAIFVTESQVSADIIPTPISFLVKPISGYTIFDKTTVIGDFLLMRQDAFEVGITVAGKLSCDIIPSVAWSLIKESLDFLFPHIVPNFKNPILMLCRIAYAHTFHQLCSKRDAGKWAATAFGEQWFTLINIALVEYNSGTPTASVPISLLQEYEQYCISYINSLPTYD